MKNKGLQKRGKGISLLMQLGARSIAGFKKVRQEVVLEIDLECYSFGWGSGVNLGVDCDFTIFLEVENISTM